MSTAKYTPFDGESGRARTGVATTGFTMPKWSMYAVGAVVLLIAVFFLMGSGSSKQSVSNSEERLIPFMPNMMTIPDMVQNRELMSLDEEWLQEIEYIPYSAAKKLCRSPHFENFGPSLDRVMYEISIGNCGSTWQIITLSAITHSHGKYMPVHHISYQMVQDWDGYDKLELTDQKGASAPNADGEDFGRLFKLQHFVEEMYEKAALRFSAFKVNPGKMDEVYQFAAGVCPCCFLHKASLGRKENEIALIYMHAFAIGVDMTEDDVLHVRRTQAEWIKRHYCYPGSVHTSACAVLDEFPDLKGFHPDYYDDEVYDDDYSDDEEAEGEESAESAESGESAETAETGEDAEAYVEGSAEEGTS